MAKQTEKAAADEGFTDLKTDNAALVNSQTQTGLKSNKKKMRDKNHCASECFYEKGQNWLLWTAEDEALIAVAAFVAVCVIRAAADGGGGSALTTDTEKCLMYKH